MNPLLSICIPTFNRSQRLRVMLEALLPQVAEHADKVECWVSDNASPDQTPQVVEGARQLGPIQYSRNETNIGLVSNVIKCATELGRGEFVWVLGDDDLLAPGALGHVLARLEANRSLDLIYVNFGHANYERHWPLSALGGYVGPVEGFANLDTADRPLPQWREMVRAHNLMGGQVYVHLIRRSVWQDYWRGRPRRQDFSDTLWSYPHGVMIAETVMNKPSYYVGEPVLTIFNGGQSWWEERHSIVFKFPGLVEAYRANGLPESQARECERMAFNNCEPLLVELLRGEVEHDTPGIVSFLRLNWRRAEAWRTLARASRTAGRPRTLVPLFSAASRLRAHLALR